MFQALQGEEDLGNTAIANQSLLCFDLMQKSVSADS